MLAGVALEGCPILGAATSDVDDRGPVPVNPRWKKRESVPQTVTVATLPRARALNATLAVSASSSSGRVAVYGVDVVASGAAEARAEARGGAATTVMP